MTAVKAIHAATNRAFGFTLSIKIPLKIIPTPMTSIPPTPVKRNNDMTLIFNIF